MAKPFQNSSILRVSWHLCVAQCCVLPWILAKEVGYLRSGYLRLSLVPLLASKLPDHIMGIMDSDSDSLLFLGGAGG